MSSELIRFEAPRDMTFAILILYFEQIITLDCFNYWKVIGSLDKEKIIKSLYDYHDILRKFITFIYF